MTFGRGEIYRLATDQDALLDMMRNTGLLLSGKCCPKCGEEMHWTERASVLDRFVWQCNGRACSKARLSIRNGSLFSGSHLGLGQLLITLYEHARGSGVESICADARIGHNAAVHWISIFRWIQRFYFERLEPMAKIGGPGATVEIDETLVARRKNHVGRTVRQQWLFGGVVRGSHTPLQFFLELVPDRKKATLGEVLLRRVDIRSVIFSDQWGGYVDLARLGFAHYTVNHSKNFLNPNDKEIHTQSIESLWSKLKRDFRRKGLSNRLHLEDYIVEFLYREQFSDVFDALIQHIAAYNRTQ